MLLFLRNVDAVTVSTVTLGESIRKMTPRPSFVVENAIDLDRWRDAQLARDARLSVGPSDTVTIGWMASGSHLIDIPLVDKALCDILQEHSNVRLSIIGTLSLAHFAKYGLARYGDRMTFTNWVEINDLPNRMAAFDIALAPLVDCPFNRCKSGLKWMQNNALGIPGVYSDLPLYRDLCTNGVDGFPATPGNWKEPLEALVKDADLRKRISSLGLQNVQKHNILVTAGNWVAAWKSIMQIWM
jgi:glycosyltransferase involved in cell wall biosynthesis